MMIAVVVLQTTTAPSVFATAKAAALSSTPRNERCLGVEVQELGCHDFMLTSSRADELQNAEAAEPDEVGRQVREHRRGDLIGF